MNRGFLNGPICPIYGIGVVLVSMILKDYQENLFVLYVVSVIVTTLLEWITGLLLEKLFGQRWWDYSDKSLNIQGYVCLPFSLVWGVACVVIVKVFHPITMGVLQLLPKSVVEIILVISSVAFIADIYVTVHEILKLNMKLRKMQEIADNIRSMFTVIGENLSENVITGMERQEKAKKKLEEKYQTYLKSSSYTHRRLLFSFPKMESLRYKNQLLTLKQYLEKKKKDKS